MKEAKFGIHYEEVGSGFPLLVIPRGGFNSTVAGLATHPFNPAGKLGLPIPPSLLVEADDVIK